MVYVSIALILWTASFVGYGLYAKKRGSVYVQDILGFAAVSGILCAAWSVSLPIVACAALGLYLFKRVGGVVKW